MKANQTSFVLAAIVTTTLCGMGTIASAQEKSGQAVVYTASKFITMERSAPEARAVAIADGKIVAVGSLDEVKEVLGTRPHEIDRRFADKVVMPGFIDNHVHPLLVGALVLQMEFITPFDWNLPSGRVKGVQGRDAFLARLGELEASMENPDEWLWTWGHHANFHGDVFRDDIDAISSTRPIVVWGRSFHEVRLNTPALKALGFLTVDDPRHPQIDWDKGWAKETGFKTYFTPKLAPILMASQRIVPALKAARTILHMGGITTAAEMVAGATDFEMEWNAQKAVLNNNNTPFRVLYIPSAMAAGRYGGYEQAEQVYADLPEWNTHRMKFVKQVKLFADGAFYAQYMQMQDGYTDGHDGEWMMPPEELERAARVFWNRGWQIHVHVNGDLGMKATLDVLEKLLKENPREDHRFTMHHAGYFTEEQAKRMGELGVVVSAQPYYLRALGEKYADVGLGPERAHYIGRYNSLLDSGVKLSFHSDFTMAPAEPLLLAWVAVTRLSASGNVLGPEERITVDQALRAITIDAAYAIQMEDQIGSIAPGKLADFTVLEKDPYVVGAEGLKDIPIWGTVFEGKLFPVR